MDIIGTVAAWLQSFQLLPHHPPAKEKVAICVSKPPTSQFNASGRKDSLSEMVFFFLWICYY